MGLATWICPNKIPGGKALKAPTCVPTSPETVVAAPVLLNAPSAVKSAKFAVVPRLGD